MPRVLGLNIRPNLAISVELITMTPRPLLFLIPLRPSIGEGEWVRWPPYFLDVRFSTLPSTPLECLMGVVEANFKESTGLERLDCHGHGNAHESSQEVDSDHLSIRQILR